MASIVVADPPAPPVPIPINNFLLPSAKANSAFARLVGAEDPVDLFIRTVLAMCQKLPPSTSVSLVVVASALNLAELAS